MAITFQIWPDRKSIGGQHVGTGPNGIRAVHTIAGQPTGIEAVCEYHRSQHKNKIVVQDMVEWACAQCKLPIEG